MGSDRNEYPKDLAHALRKLNHYRPERKMNKGNGNDGVLFFQHGEEGKKQGITMTTDAETRRAKITCYTCGEKGHYANECPVKDKKQVNAYLMSTYKDPGGNEERVKVDDNWLLLDSQSTIDVIKNPEMLENIEETDEELTIHCTAGTSKTRKRGTLPEYGKVWYYPEGISQYPISKKCKEEISNHI